MSPVAWCPHHIWDGWKMSSGWLLHFFKPSSNLLSFQPSSPTLTPLNPDGRPALGHSLQASACQGSLCSPLAGTQACALKLSPPPTAASAGGYLSNRSPNWPTVCLISLTFFELWFEVSKGFVTRNTFIVQKVKVWWQQCTTAHNNTWQEPGYSLTVVVARTDCWWDCVFCILSATGGNGWGLLLLNCENK